MGRGEVEEGGEESVRDGSSLKPIAIKIASGNLEIDLLVGS